MSNIYDKDGSTKHQPKHIGLLIKGCSRIWTSENDGKSMDETLDMTHINGYKLRDLMEHAAKAKETE